MSKGATLIVTVANGTKVVCDDVIGVGLTFLSGGEV